MTLVIPRYPLGRGLVVDDTVLEGLCNNDLGGSGLSGDIDNQNLAPDAGLPETLIRWDATNGHDHRDGSLAQACIADPQITVGGERGVQWVMTQRPGTLCVVGVTPSFYAKLATDEEDIGHLVTVQFAARGTHGIIFEPGTRPTVILNLYDSGGTVFGLTNDDEGNANVHLYLQDTNELGFSFIYWSRYTRSYTTQKLRAFYMAVGAAPGSLADPKGVE